MARGLALAAPGEAHSAGDDRIRRLLPGSLGRLIELATNSAQGIDYTDPRLSRRAAEARSDRVVVEIVKSPHGEGQTLVDGKAADNGLQLATRTRLALRTISIP